MHRRVELLALGLDAADAELGQRLLQPALGHLDALDERGERRVAAAALLLRHRVDGAAEVVADRQHVAGEIRHRVLARVGDLALGPPAEVLHLGERAQELVLEVGDLGAAAPRLRRRRRRPPRGACGGRRRLPSRAWSRRPSSVVQVIVLVRVRPGYQGSRAKNQAPRRGGRLRSGGAPPARCGGLAPLLRIRWARGRVGRMFSRRLTRLMRLHRPSATRSASASSTAA